MQSPNKSGKKNNLKRWRLFLHEMPVTDSTAADALDNCTVFPVEDIVQYPLSGYGVATAISFSLDNSLIAYLFSPDQTLSRKLFVFDPKSGKHELFFSPPDGGLDESNLSVEEKLRRERLRERGLGEVVIPSVPCSPIIDPHLSPDGTRLAYVRDDELHVSNLLYHISKQLTEGATRML